MPSELFSRSDRLKANQVKFFAMLARELCDVSVLSPDGPISEWPEYIRFIEGAYACGFVTGDFSATGKLAGGVSYEAVQKTPRIIQDCSLQTVRHVVHILVRAERSNLDLIDDEWGTIRQALATGLVNQIARRLEALLAD
jgi:hypothetical protein